MSVPTPPAAKPPKDPFGPPLDEGQVREVFRRLSARPPAEQRAFVTRINWNLLDPTVELQLMAWLARGVAGPEPAFALELLNKLPHPKRARHAARFRALLADLSPATAAQLQNAFGPVLGGLPKRPGGQRPGGGPPKPDSPPKPEPEPKEASHEQLESLKAFFDKFGGNR